MGRSVSTPSNASVTVYLDMGELDGPDDWDGFIDGLRDVVRTKYPTMEDDDRWLDREDHVIASNAHADLVVCEYCGCVSVSLVPTQERSGYYPEQQNLHDAWCEQVAVNFRDLLHRAFPDSAMGRIGTMSNGVSVYQKIGA